MLSENWIQRRRRQSDGENKKNRGASGNPSLHPLDGHPVSYRAAEVEAYFIWN
jgi:hypothetical protein